MHCLGWRRTAGASCPAAAMTAVWCETGATSLVPCFGWLSRSCFRVLVLLGFFLRRRYPSAVTVPVTDSALKLRSTMPSRWVGFPARAFW